MPPAAPGAPRGRAVLDGRAGVGGRPIAADLHRISVKVFVAGGAPDDDATVRVFHAWIQKQADRPDPLGILIDVADYKHVSGGPGIVLVGHEMNLATDRAGGAPGLVYQRKRPFDASLDLAGRIRACLDSLLGAAGRLEADLDVRFGRDVALVVANDRLAAPNDESGWAVLGPAVEALARSLGGRAERVRNDPRERLAATIRARLA